MAQHPPAPGELATRNCADCGTTVNLGDARTKQYARDTATGLHGQLMPTLYPGSRLAFLRPIEGGKEWTTDVESLVPCDRDGNPLPAEATA